MKDIALAVHYQLLLPNQLQVTDNAYKTHKATKKKKEKKKNCLKYHCHRVMNPHAMFFAC